MTLTLSPARGKKSYLEWSDVPSKFLHSFRVNEISMCIFRDLKRGTLLCRFRLKYQPRSSLYLKDVIFSRNRSPEKQKFEKEKKMIRTRGIRCMHVTYVHARGFISRLTFCNLVNILSIFSLPLCPSVPSFICDAL